MTVRLTLKEILGPIAIDHFVGYLYGIGGTRAFADTFSGLLAQQAGPIRIPITTNRQLFDEVSSLGTKLLHWHTFGERFGRGEIQITATEISPISGRPSSFGYDSRTNELTVGGGRVGPVTQDVYDFEVSGFKVLQNWLGNRTAEGRGRKSSPLDEIRYEEWTFTDELLLVIAILQHTVDVTPQAQALLDEVLDGEVFLAAELPQPTDAERKAPR